MKLIVDKSLSLTRKVYGKIIKVRPLQHFIYDNVDFSGQKACDLIYEKIIDPKPCMIARFGSGELDCVTEYYNSQKSLRKYIQFVKGEIDSYDFSDRTFDNMFTCAGMFPSNREMLTRFSKLMLESMSELDIMGCWLKNEYLFEDKLRNAVKVKLSDIEPYYHANPWTRALKGKKVLIVHPFAHSIANQYKKKSFLFKNEDVLPDFELITIQAVQSLAGQETKYSNWFDALADMEKQIAAVDFDVAIIGCGAYGFLLAAYVKRLGKKSVHMGGATQILFGIKGKRWDDNEVISSFYNDFWVYPTNEERPNHYQKVENGCYW